MNTVRKRLLRRSLIVIFTLGTIGFLFGKVFLMFVSMYASNGADPGNQRVLWQTPLVMAGFGLILTFALEAVAFALRKRPSPVPVSKPLTVEELLQKVTEKKADGS
jgi:hypothetical protein